MTNTNTPPPELTFEKVMESLEKIVNEMEEGTLPLETLVQKYEEGTKLSKLCREKLQGFERKIELLMHADTENPVWQNIEENRPATLPPKTARKNTKTVAVAENETLPF